ncbi:hypothetical protein SDC9_175410 [bioreactor metagenome]|uniref:Uncharacterized protein n=1 Tax=bioreactor metagenome TaxID=1076179 RepID=A0A645GP66_9ZZZZ
MEAFQQLLLRKGVAVEELLHLFLAGFGHGFAKLLVEILHHLRLVGGNGDFFPASVGL